MNTTATGFDTNNKSVAQIEDEGTFVHIHDPAGKPMYFGEMTDENPDGIPVGITTAGSYSTRYRKAEEAIRRRPIKPKQLTGEKFYDEAIEKTAACALSWQGFFADGQSVPCNKQNALELYDNFPWVYDQVVEAMHEHERFFKKSSNS